MLQRTQLSEVSADPMTKDEAEFWRLWRAHSEAIKAQAWNRPKPVRKAKGEKWPRTSGRDW